MNYSLSRLAVGVERRVTRGRRAVGAEAGTEIGAAAEQSTATVGA